MGYLTHAFIAICLVALSCNRVNGQSDYDYYDYDNSTELHNNNSTDLTDLERQFAEVFVYNVINSGAFTRMTEKDIAETTDILLTACQLLKQSQDADEGQKKTLIFAFASSMAELILNKCDGNLILEQKIGVITNALRQAYLQTTGKPNEPLIQEVHFLISLFFKLESPGYLNPWYYRYGQNHGYRPSYGYGGLHHPRPPLHYHPFPQLHPIPPGAPFHYHQVTNGNIRLYYLNGTEVPQSELPHIFQTGQLQRYPENFRYATGVSGFHFGGQIIPGQYQPGDKNPGDNQYGHKYPGNYHNGPGPHYGYNPENPPEYPYIQGGEFGYIYGGGVRPIYPYGENGEPDYTYGPEAPPTAPDGHTLGPGGEPTGPGGQPIGPVTTPQGPGAQPTGPGGQPIGPGTTTKGPGVQPTGPGGQPIGPVTTPQGPGAQPTGPGGQPIGPKTTTPINKPSAEPGNPQSTPSPIGPGEGEDTSGTKGTGENTPGASGEISPLPGPTPGSTPGPVPGPTPGSTPGPVPGPTPTPNPQGSTPQKPEQTQPEHPVGPSQTTQLIPQPDGPLVLVEHVRNGSTPGIITDKDHKIIEILLPPGGGTTPVKLPGPGGNEVLIIPASTPGVITDSENHLSKIILYPIGPGEIPLHLCGQENTPQQPGQETTQGAVTDSENDAHRLVLPHVTPSPLSIETYQTPNGPGETPQQPGQPMGPRKTPQAIPQSDGPPIIVLPSMPGYTPGTITGPDHKISQIILPPGGESTPGYIPGPNKQSIYIQPGRKGITPGVVRGPDQQITKIVLPDHPSPVNAPLPKPGSSLVGPPSRGRTIPEDFNPKTATPSNNAAAYNPKNPNSVGLQFQGLPNSQNLIKYLPYFENIFEHSVYQGSKRIPELMQIVLRAKGKTPDTFNLREFVKNMSAMFGLMRYENPDMPYIEVYMELMMETLIGTLEIIRNSDSSCLDAPSKLGGIPKYINAFYDILI